MNRLFLMCGLLFSGKTTAARQIAKHRQAALISLDKINEERGLGFGGDGKILRLEWKETHQIALSRIEELMTSGQDIVIDDTNCFRFLRDGYRKMADIYNYHTTVIQTTIPVEEIQSRMLFNEKSGERHGVKEHVLADLVQHFEWPDPDEETIIFTSLEQVATI